MVTNQLKWLGPIWENHAALIKNASMIMRECLMSRFQINLDDERKVVFEANHNGQIHVMHRNW